MGTSFSLPRWRAVSCTSRMGAAWRASSKNISKKSPMRYIRRASGCCALTSRYWRIIGVRDVTGRGDMRGEVYVARREKMSSGERGAGLARASIPRRSRYISPPYEPPRPRYRLPPRQRGPGAGRGRGGRAVGRAGALLHAAAGDGPGGARRGGDREGRSRRRRRAAGPRELHRPADRPRHRARTASGAGDSRHGPPLPPRPGPPRCPLRDSRRPGDRRRGRPAGRLERAGLRGGPSSGRNGAGPRPRAAAAGRRRGGGGDRLRGFAAAGDPRLAPGPAPLGAGTARSGGGDPGRFSRDGVGPGAPHLGDLLAAAGRYSPEKSLPQTPCARADVTASEPIVRSACEADLDRIVQLEEMAFHDPWPREMLAYELAHPHALLLVASRTGGPPDAYAAFRHAVGEAELLRIGVNPEARRQGLARVLILEGLERLRRLDVQVCFLEVRVDNQSAIDLYERLGFSCTGHRKGYYRDGVDALIFVLGI